MEGEKPKAMNKRKYCRMCGRRLFDTNLPKVSMVYRLLRAIGEEKVPNKSEIVVDICRSCCSKALKDLKGGEENGRDGD